MLVTYIYINTYIKQRLWVARNPTVIFFFPPPAFLGAATSALQKTAFEVFSLVGRDYTPQLSTLNGLDGFYWAAPISVAWFWFLKESRDPLDGPSKEFLDQMVFRDQWVKKTASKCTPNL